MLPIWGAKLQRHQRAERIRLLEMLHGDTNHLTFTRQRSNAYGSELYRMIGFLAVMAVITGAPSRFRRSSSWL
jgi:hypothetical protein